MTAPGSILVALKMNLAQLNQPDPQKAKAVLAESNQLLDTWAERAELELSFVSQCC